MADYNTPDLSNVKPVDLPRPTSVIRPAAPASNEEEIAKLEPNPLLRTRRSASLQDMADTRPTAPPGTPPMATAPIDPAARSSFATAEQLRLASQPQGAEPVHQEPAPRAEPETIPTVLATVTPTRKRDIRELFTLGKMRETKNVAGFDLQFNTLTAEEYTRAWAMASVFPEGNARETAIRQYLLAFSVSTINNYHTEDLCQSAQLTDKIQRRADVFANLDTNLVRQFFEQGYLVLHTKTQELLENLSTNVSAAANFTPPSQR